jgi:hypothetical protein
MHSGALTKIEASRNIGQTLPGVGRTRFEPPLRSRTPLTREQASQYLARAWRQRFGSAPEALTLVVLTAHWALETGRGDHMHGYNFGGIKASAGDAGAIRLPTLEGAGAQARRTQARFRAYATPLEGARDYIETLAQSYPQAQAAAAAGNAPAFADALARGRYFTADPSAYRSALVSLTHEYTPRSTQPTLSAPGFLVNGVVRAFQLAIERRG